MATTELQEQNKPTTQYYLFNSVALDRTLLYRSIAAFCPLEFRNSLKSIAKISYTWVLKLESGLINAPQANTTKKLLKLLD